MYFVSDFNKLDAKEIHRMVKYFSAPSVQLLFLSSTPSDLPALKLNLPHRAIPVVLPLTHEQALLWKKHLAPRNNKVWADDSGVSLSLCVKMTCQGPASPELVLELHGETAASLSIDIALFSDLCASFAQHDLSPLMYTLYHINAHNGTWTLRCFDKKNAPLRLLTPPHPKCSVPDTWKVKPIPFPKYFTDKALHDAPYSQWGDTSHNGISQARRIV